MHIIILLNYARCCLPISAFLASGCLPAASLSSILGRASQIMGSLSPYEAHCLCSLRGRGWLLLHRSKLASRRCHIRVGIGDVLSYALVSC